MPSKLTVRCTEQEYQAIQEKSDKLGMALSEYVRFVSIHAKVDVHIKQLIRADLTGGKPDA